jgi:HAD superfamily hydrolase (TIGR01549 family)
MKKVGIVPLKLKSRRLPNKNFLRLGDHPMSFYIFKTLLELKELKELDEVYCYTSEPRVLDLLPEGVRILLRPKDLDGDEVKANELFRYAVEKVDAELIVLGHATAPFLRGESIQKGIKAITSGEYDCSFSVLRHQTYSWLDGKPINYNPMSMAQTQGLIPVYTESSGFYVFRKTDYLKSNTRVNGKPKLIEVSFKEAIDIDEPKDLNLATHLLKFNHSDRVYSNDEFFVRIANGSENKPPLRHISFDMDGVLIDSIPVMVLAWREVCLQFSLDIPFSEYKARIGLPFYDILEEIGVPKNIFNDVHEVYNRVSKEHREEILLYEGVEETLSKLHHANFKITVVTSKFKERAKELLDYFGLNKYVHLLVTPEDVLAGRGKPNPDSILKACCDVGASPSETIYVGDMEADRLAAERAHCMFAHASWGYGDISHTKDVWFNSMQDLATYIICESNVEVMEK